MAAGRVRHADMWPCAAQDSVQASSDPSQERKRGPGNAAMGQADRDRDWCNGKTRKTTQNCKLKPDDVADEDAKFLR